MRRVSVRERLRHLARGLRFGYPPCCALRYALNVGTGQAARRGVRATRMGQPYVPCLWLHPAQRPAGLWGHAAAWDYARRRSAGNLSPARSDPGRLGG